MGKILVYHVTPVRRAGCADDYRVCCESFTDGQRIKFPADSLQLISVVSQSSIYSPASLFKFYESKGTGLDVTRQGLLAVNSRSVCHLGK